MKRRLKTLLRHLAFYVSKRPWLNRIVKAALKYFPFLRAKLNRVAMGGGGGSTSTVNIPKDLAHLGPYARQIYGDLNIALKSQKKMK